MDALLLYYIFKTISSFYAGFLRRYSRAHAFKSSTTHLQVLRVIAAHGRADRGPRPLAAASTSEVLDAGGASRDKARSSLHVPHARGQAPGGAQLPAASARLAWPPLDLPDPPPIDAAGSYLAGVRPGLLVWPPPQGLPPNLPLEVKTRTHANTNTATVNCGIALSM